MNVGLTQVIEWRQSLSHGTLVEVKFLRLKVHVFEITLIASYTSMVLSYSPAPPESLIKFPVA